MSKYILSVILAGSLVFACAAAGISNAADSAGNKPARRTPESLLIKPASSRLPEHERLVYKARWLGIPVGTATSCIKGIKKIRGRDAYELEITVKTNDFCSRIYKIDDRYVSFMDVEKLCTLRHEVYRREGRYKKDAVTDFDQVNHKAYFKNFLDRSEKVVKIPPLVHDPVSMAYYFRLVPLEIGRMNEYSVYNNESVYQIYGVAEEKVIRKIPRLGPREVFSVQPYAKLKGEVVRKGRAKGYFSADEKRVPLIGIVKGPVFSEVVAYLVKSE